MRTSIILGRRHDSDSVEVIGSPLRPDEQNAKWKELIVGDGNGFAEIHLHELVLSGGRKRQNFAAPRVKAEATHAATGDKPKGSDDSPESPSVDAEGSKSDSRISNLESSDKSKSKSTSKSKAQ